MPETSKIQTNFTSGELSPRLRGRTDLSKYDNGVETQLNFISQVHGGVIRRSGTRFLAEVKDSTRLTRLIPFAFNVTETYMIELGNLYGRFYRADSVGVIGRLTTSFAIVAVNIGLDRFDVLGDQEDNVAPGDVITIDGSTRTDEDASYTVSTVTFNIPNTEIVVTGDVTDATVDGNITLPTEIVTPWSDTQIREIKYAQSADILYLCHPDVEPQKIARLPGDDSLRATWQVAGFRFIDGPYDSAIADGTTVTFVGTGNTRTVTSSTAKFASTDVNRVIRIDVDNGEPEDWQHGRITTFTSPTEVIVTTGSSGWPLDHGATPLTAWRLGRFSDTTLWPWVPLFHEQRIWMGGHDDNPQTLTASEIIGPTISGVTIIPEDFSPTDAEGNVLATDGLVMEIGDNQVNAIRKLFSHTEGLVIATDGGTWILRGGGANDIISPVLETLPKLRRQDRYPASDLVIGHNVNGAILLTSRSGREVREIAFKFEDNRFVSPEMTILSEHITIGGLLDSTYQAEPDSIMWSVRNDGTLLGFTYEREQEVTAWHRHTLGGSFGTGDAVVDACSVVRIVTSDVLFLIVKRTINAITRRYVEFVEDQFDVNSLVTNAFFVDSGLTYNGVPATVITGLDHLEGETVKILVDGGSHPDRTVLDGDVILDAAASVVHVGLRFQSDLKTMPVFARDRRLETRGKLNRIFRTILQFNQTLGGEVGVDGDTLDPIVYRNVNDPVEDSPPLFSGVKDISFPGDYAREVSFTVRSDEPLPLTLLSIDSEMVVDGL